MDEREELFNLWLKHGTCVESDSSEGWELVDAILAAGYGKLERAWDEGNDSYDFRPNPYRGGTNG